MIATMGPGAVVSCTADRLDWAQQHLGQLDRDELFSLPVLARINDLVRPDGQFVAGPNLLYVGFPNTIFPARCPEGITIELFEQDRVPSLYAHEGFRHALHYRVHEERPDVLATVACHGDRIVGIAGASADTVDLWQIGIEITREFQGRGIGKTLTSRLAEAILNRGKVPYYATLPSNIVSRNVAMSVGLRPCWTEVGTFDGNPFPPISAV